MATRVEAVSPSLRVHLERFFVDHIAGHLEEPADSLQRAGAFTTP